jgi:hypothetical protein
MQLNRRRSLGALGALAFGLTFSERAEATLVRGLSLRALSTKSQRALVGVAFDARSHVVEVGGQRRIVTDTRLGVREVVFGGATSEIIVRTLGGRVDGVGELVSGQPELELGRAGVLFLFEGPEAIHHVVGMAQGHFPLLADGRGRERLSASPKLPKIADFAESAVRKLAGLELPRARSLVLEARKP